MRTPGMLWIIACLGGAALTWPVACGGGGGGSAPPGGAVATTATGTATLSWTAPPEPNVAGYKVYVGTSSQSYGPPVDVGNQTSYTATQLRSGARVYLAVSAYNSAGSESALSPEVFKDVP